MWNQRYLLKPTDSNIVFTREDFKEFCQEIKLKSSKTGCERNATPEIWVTEIQSYIKNAVEAINSCGKHFKVESLCLQAFLFHENHNRKFKFMQNLRKLAKCLKRWKELDIINELSTLLQKIPKEFFFIKNIRLPSPDYFGYVLHRAIGGFRLLLQILSYGLDAARSARDKLEQGHFVGEMTFIMAMVARIRFLSIDMANTLADMHEKMWMLLKPVMAESAEELSVDLTEELMRARYYYEKRGGKEDPASKKRKYENDLKPQTVTNSDENENCRIEPEEKVQKVGAVIPIFNNFDDEDLGEEVSYSAFEELKKKSSDIIEAPTVIQAKAKKFTHKQIFKTKKRKIKR